MRCVFGAIRIVSGFRCPAHNRELGGAPNSQHLVGLAADILVESDNHRYSLVYALLRTGFLRLGIARDYVHADIGTPTGPVIWTYYH